MKPGGPEFSSAADALGERKYQPPAEDI